MRHRKKRVIASFLLLVILLMSGCSKGTSPVRSDKTETMILRLATDLSEESPGYRQLEDFQKRLSSASGGRL